MTYNQQVLERDRELRQELELSRVTQTEMINRLALYQRLIKQLNERISAEVYLIAHVIILCKHYTNVGETSSRESRGHGEDNLRKGHDAMFQ